MEKSNLFNYLYYAKHLSFPADKTTLISNAYELELPLEFFMELDTIPDRIYDSYIDLFMESELNL